MAREVFRHAELGQALAWLRDRARLTQVAAATATDALLRERWQDEQTANRVTQEPASFFSTVYLKKIESGERAPALEKLELLLRALGSELPELEGLLASRPWQQLPVRARVRSRAAARPAAFIAAAEQALAGGQWSSPVALTHSPPRNGLFSRGQVKGRLVQDQALRELGELAELRTLFLNMPRAEQLALLADARSRRFPS